MLTPAEFIRRLTPGAYGVVVGTLIGCVVFILIAIVANYHPDPAAARTPDPWISVGNGVIRMVTIDGVRCVLYNAHQEGGISCDWRAP